MNKRRYVNPVVEALLLVGLLAGLLMLAADAGAGEVVSSETVGLVRFGSAAGLAAREGQAEPGVLVATVEPDSGSNTTAYLTVGVPGGLYAPVRDRYALRRAPYEDLDYPDIYLELGTNTTLVGDHTVRVFDGDYVAPSGQDPNIRYYTRSFKVVPINGKVIRDLGIKVTLFQAAGWSGLAPESLLLSTDVVVSDETGEALVTATVNSGVDVAVTYTCEITVTRVLGQDRRMDELRDDLTLGDYFFIDEYGRTSLGKLRSWVRRTYDDYKADLWARYRACQTVDLGGQTAKFSKYTFVQTTKTAADNDTLTLWQNGNVMLRSVSSVATTNGAFRIVGIETPVSGDYDYIYTDKTVSTAPWVQTCTDLEDGLWTTPPGQITTEGTYKGDPAWVIAVPKTGDKRKFFRAYSENGQATDAYLYTEATVYAHGGVAVQSPDGSWWKLVVDNSGNLTPTKVTDVPEGVVR